MESSAGDCEIESCSQQIHFSLIIERNFRSQLKCQSPAIQCKQLITKSVDHANSGFLKNNQHFEKRINTLGLKQCIPGK